MMACETDTPPKEAVTFAERVAKNTSYGMTVAKIQMAQKKRAHSWIRRKCALLFRRGRKRETREKAETMNRTPHPAVKTAPTSNMSKGDGINRQQHPAWLGYSPLKSIFTVVPLGASLYTLLRCWMDLVWVEVNQW